MHCAPSLHFNIFVDPKRECKKEIIRLPCALDPDPFVLTALIGSYDVRISLG